MRLNHVNLCASDVAALTATLRDHFGYRVLEQGQVPDIAGVAEAGSDYAVLAGDDGSYLVLSQIAAPAPGESAYPPHFHVGLIQDTERDVYDKHTELTAAGYSPGRISAGFQASGATWTAFFCDIGDGLVVEVNFRTRSDVLDRADAGR